MKYFVFSLAVLWLLQFVTASDYVELEPIPRHLWDRSIQKRDDAAQATEPANITLADHEQMLWTNPPNTTTGKTVVSMVVWTGQDRMIVDMARFAFELKAVNCTENMWVQFRHNISFQAAKKNWEWVNFNGMRTFVVIADHIKCGKDWSPNPWLVGNVRFDQATLKVFMDAEKKTWKSVTHSYSLDFGEVERGNDHQKRQFDVDFDKAFTLDLSSHWPSTIISETWNVKNGEVTFGVSCTDCGTSGTLVFAGHIEGSIFGGLEKFEISATPHGIRADLDIEVALAGGFNFEGVDWASKNFTLLQIPLPTGWTIRGVFTFGPHADIIAGYKLDNIEGEAKIGTGVSAVVPDDSVARVDLLAKKKVDIHGWIPTLETRPLSIEAQISASGSVFTELAVAASIEIFDEDGINVDVYLKLPKFLIKASAGYNPDGFCPNSEDPFGVSLDVTIGAEVGLEGWYELDGKRTSLFDVDLFVSDNLFKFPLVCLHFGGASPGSCSPDIEPEDALWYAIEVADSTPFSLMARSPWFYTPRPYTPRSYIPRAALASDRQYALACDPSTDPKNPTWPIDLKDYPGPTDIKNAGAAGNPVPVMKSMMSCKNDALSGCDAPNWHIELGTKNDVGSTYNAEHIYEGFWLKEYMDKVKSDLYSGTTCESYATSILKLGKSTGALNEFSDRLLFALGNHNNYGTTMTLLNSRENTVKHRMFNPAVANIYVYEGQPFTSQVCRLGRIVTACKYMEMKETQDYMGNTIRNITRTLFDMDGELFGGATKTVDLHRTWFTGMYAQGITKTQNYLVAMATYIKKNADAADYAKLTDATRTAIERLSSSTNENKIVEEYCKNNLDYQW